LFVTAKRSTKAQGRDRPAFDAGQGELVRIVFMGTPEFAVPSLFALVAAGVDVAAIYTRPDAISGRGGATRAPLVKVAALELGVPVRQPTTLRDASEIDTLALVQADLIVVAAYGIILPVEALQAARLGTVNVHASLLPRWRGAAPIQRAILAGDESTGVSIMRMEAGLDTGPYCAQSATSVATKTAAQLTAELAELGARTLVSSIPSIEDGSARWALQDSSLATYADKVLKSDVAITPEMTRLEVERRARASMPASPCKVSISGRGVTLLDARLVDVAVAPGAVACSKSGLLLGASDGAVEVIRVRPDGKGDMDSCAWVRGLRDLADARWASFS
jgi:methionyl-tRNA formyltransferase